MAEGGLGVFPLEHMPKRFEVWELNTDWMFDIGAADLAKPATGRRHGAAGDPKGRVHHGEQQRHASENRS